MSAGEHGPLAQFEVTPIVNFHAFGVDLSFSNQSLYMFIAVGLISLFMTLSVRGRALVPGRWQNLAELCYEFVANMIKENVGEEGRQYFPFIFSLFMFILFCNLLGMTPYSFTVTSHIAVTFALAIFIFVSVTIIGFARHGIGYLKLFLPSGTPWWMMPLIVPIEVFSYCVRPVSLSIRLAANMMAGHILLKVMAGFIIAMGVFGIAPLIFNIALVGFEIFVAMLQAYIFTILTCVYLNDAIHMH